MIVGNYLLDLFELILKEIKDPLNDHTHRIINLEKIEPKELQAAINGLRDHLNLQSLPKDTL